MQLEVFPYIRDSLFIETLLLIISIRIIWAQLIPQELAVYKSSPFIWYFPRRRSLQSRMLLSGIQTIQGSQSLDLEAVLREEVEQKKLVLRYNKLNSEREWHIWFLFAAALALILHYNPLSLISVIVADLLIARIHHHLRSAL